MAGAYCKYCDHRCFVYRVIPAEPGVRSEWGGHLATCARGKQHDREVTGYDADTAINPVVTS